MPPTFDPTPKSLFEDTDCHKRQSWEPFLPASLRTSTSTVGEDSRKTCWKVPWSFQNDRETLQNTSYLVGECISPISIIRDEFPRHLNQKNVDRKNRPCPPSSLLKASFPAELKGNNNKNIKVSVIQEQLIYSSGTDYYSGGLESRRTMRHDGLIHLEGGLVCMDISIQNRCGIRPEYTAAICVRVDNWGCWPSRAQVNMASCPLIACH